ncbi:hypothetical protein CR513_32167, partial [Mucuna pruriens]
MERKVAIIGAQTNGLVAYKYLLKFGFNPTIYEVEDGVGGLWSSPSSKIINKYFPWHSTVKQDNPSHNQFSHHKVRAFANCESESREHLSPVEAESILAQADFSGQNHSNKNVTEQEIYWDQGINDSVGLDLDLASLCINKALQATSLVWKNSGILDLASSVTTDIPKSETKSVRLRRVHPKPSQSNSVASKSALSRDRVGFVSTETKSDQSLPRASRHSTLDVLHKTLISTLSHNLTHCVLKRIDLRTFILLEATRDLRIKSSDVLVIGSFKMGHTTQLLSLGMKYWLIVLSG